MSLEALATSDEKTSPFFLANEKIVHDFEHYVFEKGGRIKGKYGAWSYNVLASIPSELNWQVRIKKATHNQPSLLLSSKYSVFVETIISTDYLNFESPNFNIKRRFFAEWLKQLLFPKWKRFNKFGRYTIQSDVDQSNSEIIETLAEILRSEFKSQKILEIKKEGSYLKIHILQDKLNQQLLEKLLLAHLD